MTLVMTVVLTVVEAEASLSLCHHPPPAPPPPVVTIICTPGTELRTLGIPCRQDVRPPLV